MPDELTTKKSYRFLSGHRLNCRTQFSVVFSQHRRVSNKYFRILVHYNSQQSVTRLGIVVSKKVSRKSVNRNRIRRQIREVFRLQQSQLKNCDMVIIAHGSCDAAPNIVLRKNLNQLLGKFTG